MALYKAEDIRCFICKLLQIPSPRILFFSATMDVYARSARYGFIPKAEYLKKANGDTIIAIQIEAQSAVENLDDILAVQGIDIIYIGPYDLSQSLGIPGEIDHPKVTDRIRQINQRVREANKFSGLYVDDVESAKKWMDAGIQFITLSVDVAIYGQACRNMIEKLK